MSSATDELRRMLDERGVEWWPMHDAENGYHQDRDTEFVIGGNKYTAHEWGGTLNVYGLTPDQAVEATLGRGALQNAVIAGGKWTTVILPDIAWQDEDWPDFLSVAHDPDGEWRTYVQGPAPNVCERIVKGKKWGNDRFVCSKCGYGLGDARWSYCPKCGGRIKR